MQIRNAGYTLEHCARLGYDIHALRAAGFPEGELLSSGIFSRQQLKQAGCDVQRYALICMYRDLDGEYWKHKTNWLTNKPISEWFGVSCDRNGFITKIDLRSNYLHGEIPSAVGLLVTLQYLDLYNNNIQGTVPDSFQNLVNLRDLWLTNNPIVNDQTYVKSMVPHCRVRL